MNKRPIITSLLAVLAAILVVLLILVGIGKNPLDFLIVLVTAFFVDTNGILISGFFGKIVPLIFAAIGVAFAFKTGLFNIGAEGQVTMGIVGATLVGSIPNLPFLIHIPLVIATAFIFGGLWGLIPGILKAVFQVHEVVITIMMNYIAFYLAKDLFFPLLADPNKVTQTKELVNSATLQSLSDTKFFQIPLNYLVYFLIALAFIALFYFIIYQTKFGFELRAGGLNPFAARYSGMNSKRNIMLAMLLSGGFAGIGGAFYLMSVGAVGTGGFVQTNIGFDGIAAALLGASAPLGVLIGSGVLTYLNLISLELQYVLTVPKEITDMIIALVLFFIAMSYLFDRIQERFFRPQVAQADMTKATTKNEGDV